MWDVNEEGSQEEVGEKSSLKWLAKEEFGQEKYVKIFGSKGEVRTVSSGLLGDKENCGMCKDGKCELCDGVEEDIVHFL